MSFAFPWIFMAYSLSYLPATVRDLVRARDVGTLTSWSRFKSAWFGRFWNWAGPRVRTGTGERRVVPLLQGRVRGGDILPDDEAPVALPVSGTVIEVGPGSGTWLSPAATAATAASSTTTTTKEGLRSRKNDGDSGRITKVYGVEPNADVHEQLHRRVAEAGLGDVYEVVPLGIEDLAKSGLVAKGSVDCVVSVLVLCGIPDPQHNIRELYEYLRPGGRMYVYEHVRHSRPLWLAIYQGK